MSITIVVSQGGGPTAVINQTLAGAALVAPIAWADIAGAALLAGWLLAARRR
mgnify:CR=1 FL=1